MIPFEIPGQFMLKVLAGDYIRYGGILKDATTGQIVGHLKEVGSLGGSLSMLPLDPASAAMQLAANAQLLNIQDALGNLKLITSVGALASIASLGVSVFGFIAISRKLKMLESKLDTVLGTLEQIKVLAERINFKVDALNLGQLQAAFSELSLAEGSSEMDNRRYYIREAGRRFRVLKHYYGLLLDNNGYSAWYDAELPLPETRDLHSRFVACVAGELYSEFLTNDLGCYRAGLEENIALTRDIGPFDKHTAYKNRTRGIFIDCQAVAMQIKECHEVTQENVARIEGMATELEYLERHDIKPTEYVRQLKDMEPGLVLCTSKG